MAELNLTSAVPHTDCGTGRQRGRIGWLIAAGILAAALLAGCAGEPKVKRTIEGMKTYAEMTDGTWTCDGRSYAYRLEIRGRLSRAACDSVFVYLSNVPEISFERAAKAAGLSSNSDDYFAPEEAVLVELGTE